GTSWIMEKATITSHKSHVPCSGRRLAARSPHAARGRRAMASAGRGDATRRAGGAGDGGNDAAADRGIRRQPAGAALERVLPATREGSVAACMVKASARHETGAWPVRRTTGTEFRFRYREGGELPARRGQSAPDKGPVRCGVPRTVPATRKQSRGVFCYRQDRVLRGREPVGYHVARASPTGRTCD